MINRVFITSALAFFVILLTRQNAYAYLDPGTGSYVLQAAIAAVIGATFAVKMYWRRIKAFFSGLLTKKRKD